MSHYQLAQINIARARAPLDQPLMSGFVEQLAPINALAERSPGFVWRLQSEAGDATSIQVFEDPLIIVNLSVWASFEALKAYVYSGEHLEVMKGKRHWMEKLDRPGMALWWVPRGQQPSIEAGKTALLMLQQTGPSPAAFTFAKPYPAPLHASGAGLDYA